MVREVAKTSDTAGDVLTTDRARAGDHREGARNVAGASPMEIKRGIRKRRVIVEQIKKMSRPCRATWWRRSADLANSDLTIGTIIAEAMERSRTASSPSRKQDARDDARRGRGCSSTAATCRLLRHRPRAMEIVLENPVV